MTSNEVFGKISSALEGILSIQDSLMESAKEDETVFTFYIDDVECTAEVGMTWEQWIESDYNTIGVSFYDEDNPVVVLNGKAVHEISGQTLMDADPIKEFRYFTN